MVGMVFSFDGDSGFSGKVATSLASVAGLPSALLDIPQAATHWVRYTKGTTALKPNEILTGATSTATCTYIAKAIETGTDGSSDTGILLVAQPSAAFQSETLTGSRSSGTVGINQDLINLIPRTSPKAALIATETASIMFTLSGANPSIPTGSGLNYGITLAAASSYVIRGYNNIRNFKFVPAAASSGAVIKYELFY